jgi:hypothetical protein
MYEMRLQERTSPWSVYFKTYRSHFQESPEFEISDRKNEENELTRCLAPFKFEFQDSEYVTISGRQNAKNEFTQV